MISDKEVEALKLKALSLCKDYLGGRWKDLDQHNIIFSRISGGLSNYLFKCTIPDYIDCCGDQPNSVILRVYGQHLLERTSEVLKDTTVSLLLSEWGIGPKVYAVRGSSRLEEFWEAKTLRTNDLRASGLFRNKIAKVLAKFHSFEMPLMKEPKWLFETIQNYLHKVRKLKFPEGNEQRMYERLLAKVNLDKEYNDLCFILQEVHSPVTFCHNDVQPGNLLLLGSGEIKLIDYEYSGYNHRGFDFGNFFCEFMFDYQCTEYPYFRCNFNEYPSIETQRAFIEEYSKHTHKSKFSQLHKSAAHTLTSQSWNCSNGFNQPFFNDNVSDCESPSRKIHIVSKEDDSSKQLILSSHKMTHLKDPFRQEICNLLREASYFSLASNFMWALWSIYLSFESRIDFCYMEYAICRLFAYFYGKHQILRDRLSLQNYELIQNPLNSAEDFLDLIDAIPEQ